MQHQRCVGVCSIKGELPDYQAVLPLEACFRFQGLEFSVEGVAVSVACIASTVCGRVQHQWCELSGHWVVLALDVAVHRTCLRVSVEEVAVSVACAASKV